MKSTKYVHFVEYCAFAHFLIEIHQKYLCICKYEYILYHEVVR